MHHCLSIPEISSRIADELAGCHNEVGELSHLGTLANLSATCRHLTEPCLDSLWRIQTSLAPLLHTMSPDLWEERDLREHGINVGEVVDYCSLVSLLL